MPPPRNKILFVSSNFPPIVGGSSVVYGEICRNAAADVVALGARHHSETGKELLGIAEHDANCGYPIYRIDHLRPPSSAKRVGSLGRITSFLGIDLPIMARTLAKILVLIVRHHVKVVCIGELVYLGWLTFPLRYVFGRRVIVYTHGEEISQNYQGISASLRESYLHRAHHIISVSLFCKSQVVSKYGIYPDRVFIVSNGVDTDKFKPGRSDREIFPVALRAKKIILSVSRLVERKGQDRLIAAMPEILRAVPNAHCLIVGEGPEAQHLAEMAEAAGLQEAITFMGRVPDGALSGFYRSSDLFVLPCHTLADGDTEGYGLVFLEANACAMAVVAGAAGGTIEAVIDGETGILIDGNDPDEIAAATVRLLTQPDLTRHLGASGYARAQSLGWPQASQAFVSVCRNEASQEEGDNFRPMSWALPNLTTAAAPGFLFTVDVEEEFLWSRFDRSNYRVRGLASLERLQGICRSVGVSPVYLITYAILQDEAYCDFFRRVLAGGGAEAGLHIHPWITPPHWEEPNVFNSYQCNLPEHLERRKLETMAGFFEARLQRRPILHRAGRWGGDAQTNRLLDEMGFEVDLSPSAGHSDADCGGTDFTNLDGRPFRSEGRRILTVPASSVRYLRGPNFVSTMSSLWGEATDEVNHWNRFGGKAVRFSPEGQPISRLRAMSRNLRRGRLPVVVSSIHSTSLYGGGNPYARTDDEAEGILATTEELVSYCIRTLGMVPTTCAELFAKTVAFGAEPTRRVPASTTRA